AVILNDMRMGLNSAMAGRATSKASMQDSSGVGLGRCAERAAALAKAIAITHLEKDQKHALETMLSATAPIVNPPRHVAARKCDETPMGLSVNGGFKPHIRRASHQPAAGGHRIAPRQTGAPHARGKQRLERRAIQLLQSAARCGDLLTSRCFKVFGIVGQSISALQRLGRNAGGRLLEADRQRSSAVGWPARGFQSNTRVPILDSAGPNRRCEAQ
ncbi:unnamed protein product, partial [Prorocentrum cordatum]